MSELFPVTLEGMIDEVKRELDMRRQVYPRAVASRRMNKREADRRVWVMESLLKKLEREQAGERDPGTA